MKLTNYHQSPGIGCYGSLTGDKVYVDITEEEIKEIEVRMEQSLNTYNKRRYERIRCPSIVKLAKYIAYKYPKYSVHVKVTSTWKDTHISGTRLRSPGTREYNGYKFHVNDENDKEIYEHDSTETYRTNLDVVRQIKRWSNPS